MSYRGSEAERLDSREFAQQGARRSFDVVEGAGLDSAVRRGVAPERLAAFRLALACVAVFLVLGVARVAVTAATVQILEANSGLAGQVSAAEDTAKELRIEAAVLSNNSRITTIATENLGMVYAGAGESLTVSVS